MPVLSSAWRALLLGTINTLIYGLRTLLQPNARPPILRLWGKRMSRVAATEMRIKTVHADPLRFEQNVPTLIFANHPCTLSSWLFVDFLYRYFGDDMVIIMRDDQPFPLNHGVNGSNFSLAIPRNDGEEARRIIRKHFEENRGKVCVYVIMADGARWTEKRYRDQMQYLEKECPGKDYSWTKHSLRWRTSGTWIQLQALREQHQNLRVFELLTSFNRPTLGTTGFFQGPDIVEHHLDAEWRHCLTRIEPDEIPRGREAFRAWFEKRCKDANAWLDRTRNQKRY